MNKQVNKQISKDEIFKIFNQKGNNVRINTMLDSLIAYMRGDDILPGVVNRMVEYTKTKKQFALKPVADAWLIELNKVLAGTEMWKDRGRREWIAMRTLRPSGILGLVQKHYYSGEVLEEPEAAKPEAELTEQEKINLRMAKLREAKRQKKLQREAEAEAFRLVEEQRKARAERPIVQYNEEEPREADDEELAQIEFLQSLNF